MERPPRMPSNGGQGRRATRRAATMAGNRPGAPAMRPFFLAGALLLLLGAVAPADEAALRDGRRLAGTLALDAKGRGLFTPDGKGEAIPLAEMLRVRFPAADLPPSRAGALHRALLDGGQYLTGELLRLGGEAVRLR